MKFLLNTVNLEDFYQQLNEIGFLHKSTANVHEFEVFKKFGAGCIRRYAYRNGLHLSVGAMNLHKDFTYSFAVEHKYFEIVYVTAGYLEVFNEDTGQLQRINAGEFLLFARRNFKGWVRHPQQEALRFVVINIEAEYVQDLAAKDLDITEKINFARNHWAVHSPRKIDLEIETLLNKICLCPYDDETIKKLFFEAVVLEILSEHLFQAELREKLPAMPVLLDHADMEQLYLAKQVLTEKMSTPPSIEELAKIVCLNTFKLKKGFKALFADTVYGYLRRARLEKAKLLLKNTRLSIHDISLQLGYCSGSSLSAIFKEHYGLTPKQYRQRQTKGQTANPLPNTGN